MAVNSPEEFINFTRTIMINNVIVDQQISISRQKAGIAHNEPIKLYRFG